MIGQGAPIWRMDRHLDKRIDDELIIYEFSPRGVLRPWELLGRDDRHVENMLGALREYVFVVHSEGRRFEDISASPVTLEHGMINHVAEI